LTAIGPSTSAISIVSNHPYSPYGDNLVPWDQLHLIGPGPSSATVGVRIETGQAVLERPDINGFGVGVQFGNFAYVDQVDHPSIWNTGVGIDCPAGMKDAGENITINQGVIFNSGIGVRSYGCGITMNENSFDGLGDSAVITRWVSMLGLLYRILRCDLGADLRYLQLQCLVIRRLSRWHNSK
jgi:hypothetical protein